MISSVVDNNPEFLEKIIYEKTNLTSFSVACAYKRLRIVEYLLQKNANVNHKDTRGYTPLYLAIWKDATTAKFRFNEDERRSIIAMILKSEQLDVFATDNEQRNYLHCACSEQDSETAMLLLQKEPRLNNAKDYLGRLPLHNAAFENNADVIGEMLKKDKDHPVLVADDERGIIKSPIVNAQDDQGATALYIACHEQHFENVKMLLQFGADAKIKNHVDEFTPFMAAVAKHNLDIISVILESDANVVNIPDVGGLTPLHQLAGFPPSDEKLKFEILEKLLAYGANVNAVDNVGRTPIIYAIRNRDLKLVKHFINAGAELRFPDNEGGTPIHYAAKSGDIAIVRELKKHLGREDFLTKNKFGENPLLVARSVEVIRFLIHDMKVDPKRTQDNNKRTFVHKIAKNGKGLSDEDITAFMEFFPDSIDKKDKFGKTPLFLAVAENNVNFVKWLLNKDVQSIDDGPYKASPFWIACLYGHYESAKELLKKNASLTQEGPDGTNASTLSVTNEHVNLINLFKQRIPSEVLEELITFGKFSILNELFANFQFPTEEKFNADLMTAILSDDVKTVLWVLERKSNFAIKTEGMQFLTYCRRIPELLHPEMLKVSDFPEFENFDSLKELLVKYFKAPYSTSLLVVTDKFEITHRESSFLTELSKKFPMFNDDDEDWVETCMQENPDMVNVISDAILLYKKQKTLEEKKTFLERNPNFKMTEPAIDLFEQFEEYEMGGFHLNEETMQKRQKGETLDLLDGIYQNGQCPENSSCKVQKCDPIRGLFTFMTILCTVMKEKWPLMKEFGMRFIPVGSVIEGTRLGFPNELDLMMDFENLQNCFEVGDNAMKLIITEKGKKKIPWKYQTRDELDKLLCDFNAVFVDLLQFLHDTVCFIKKEKSSEFPSELGFNLNSEYNPWTCTTGCKLVGPTTYKVWQHCSNHKQVVNFTKVAPCLNLHWTYPDGKKMPVSIDLVPLFHVTNSNIIELHKTVKKTLRKYRPVGWVKYWMGLLASDMLIPETLHQQQNEKGKGSKVSLKFINFHPDQNFIIRPGINFDIYYVYGHDRHTLIALKMIKALTQSKVKSFHMKKILIAEETHNRFEGEMSKHPKLAGIFSAIELIKTHPDLKNKFSGLHPALGFPEDMEPDWDNSVSEELKLRKKGTLTASEMFAKLLNNLQQSLNTLL